MRFPPGRGRTSGMEFSSLRLGFYVGLRALEGELEEIWRVLGLVFWRDRNPQASDDRFPGSERFPASDLDKRSPIHADTPMREPIPQRRICKFIKRKNKRNEIRKGDKKRIKNIMKEIDFRSGTKSANSMEKKGRSDEIRLDPLRRIRKFEINF